MTTVTSCFFFFFFGGGTVYDGHARRYLEKISLTIYDKSMLSNNIPQDNIWQIYLHVFFGPPCWKYMANLWQSNDRQQLDCFSTCSEEGLAGTLCFLMDLRVRPKAGFFPQNRRKLPWHFFPQIAIAIGVLTSNRGEGDEPLWRIGRGTRVPLQGAVDVVPLLGAIVGCRCSVLWLRGRVTTNFGGADVVPLLGAIAGCHCSVLWWGEGRATTNFGGADVVWLLGAIAGCHCSVLDGWRPTLREWTWCDCWVQ